MPQISVIVPVYNVRDYLEKCVESVRGQTFTDWELLLVDDGSADGSGELCQTLSRTDGRIRCLSQPNSGVSAARNAALSAAEGEYVTFLDGDDTLAPEHLDILWRLAQKEQADVTAIGMRLVRSDGTTEKEIRLTPGVFSGTEEILRAFLLDSEQVFGACNKLFLRSRIGELRFSALRRAEDALFCAQVLSRCGIYAVSDQVGYIYYRRNDSVTMSVPDERALDQIRGWTKIYDLFRTCAPELCSDTAAKICREVDHTPISRTDWYRKMTKIRSKFYPLQFPGGKLPWRKIPAAMLYHVSPGLYYRMGLRRARGKGGDHA